MSTMASQITSLTIIYSTIYLFRRRSKTTSKFRVTGLCGGNSPVTGDFPAPRANNAENVSIWWRHHVSQEGCCNMWYQYETHLHSNLAKSRSSITPTPVFGSYWNPVQCTKHNIITIILCAKFHNDSAAEKYLSQEIRYGQSMFSEIWCLKLVWDGCPILH